MLYERVLELAPDQEFATLGLGVCARLEGDLKAALAYHRRAQEAHPESFWPYVELAFDLFALGRLDECEAEWQRVLALRPGETNALQGLVRVRRQRGDIAGALVMLESLPDQNEAVLLERAHLLSELGRRPELWTVLLDGAARYPEDPYFMIEMSKLRALEGDLKGAVAALESAALCAPGNPQPLLGLSDLARQSQRPDLALEHLHRAKRDCRPEIWVDLGLAQTLFELGRYAESEDVLAAAQTAYPGHYLVAQVQAELLAKLGRMDNAMALVQGAVKSCPGVESLMLLAAELYQRAGQVGKASQLAAALAPRVWHDNRTRWLQLLAKLAEDDWRREDARKLFVELEQWQPDSRPALEGQIRLALLSGDLGLAREKLLKFARLEMPGRQARGLSPNVSQSFWGQYYEEYALSPDVVTQLGEIDRLPPALRLAPLMELVRQMPNWTPAASALLLAMREAGLLADESCGKGGEPAIPRLIFQYWHASELPLDIAGLMASWRALNPDWRYERFDDAGAKTWLAAHDQRALRAYLAARIAAQKSDVLRLALLYHRGGWYADADDCARTPLTDYSAQGVEFVAYQEEFATLGNNILAARPWHPIIGAALEGVVNALLRGDSDIVWLSTGPGMLTRAFAHTLAAQGGDWPRSLETVLIMSKPALNRVATPHCHASYKLAGQHWMDDQFQKAKLAGQEKAAPEAAPASKTSG